MQVARIFKALGEPIRLRLFSLLTMKKELCVCHLTAALSLPQSTVSRHLGVLRHAGLVSPRRQGKWMYYRLAEQAPESLAELVLQCVQNDQILQEDMKRLTQTLGVCRTYDKSTARQG
jgi:ArsR family transcriptional regulator